VGVRILTDEQIDKLSDKNLLAYYKKVRMIYYKNLRDEDMTFYNLRDKLKKALDERGHVARKKNPGGININSDTKDPKFKPKFPSRRYREMLKRQAARKQA